MKRPTRLAKNQPTKPPPPSEDEEKEYTIVPELPPSKPLPIRNIPIKLPKMLPRLLPASPAVRVAPVKSPIQSLNVSNAFDSNPPPFPGSLTLTGGTDSHLDQPCFSWWSLSGFGQAYTPNTNTLLPISATKVTLGPFPAGMFSLNTSDGRVTYNGESRRVMQVTFNFTLGSNPTGSPAGAPIQVWLTKNGVFGDASVYPFSRISPPTAAATYAPYSISTLMQLATGDVIQPAINAGDAGGWYWVYTSMNIVSTLN